MTSRKKQTHGHTVNFWRQSARRHHPPDPAVDCGRHRLVNTPANLFQRLDILARRIYDLGFGSVEWLFSHLLLGAMLVVPIWLLARVFGLIGGRGQDDRRP